MADTERLVLRVAFLLRQELRMIGFCFLVSKFNVPIISTALCTMMSYKKLILCWDLSPGKFHSSKIAMSNARLDIVACIRHENRAGYRKQFLHRIEAAG
jgi:hypothetical protein